MGNLETLTIDELRERLAVTDRVQEVVVSSEARNEFVLADDGRVLFRSGGLEFPATREAFLSAAKMFRVPVSYAERCPVEMIIPHINYWMRNSESNVRGLVNPETESIFAFTESRLKHFSRVAVLNELVNIMGGPGEVIVDKAVHDLHATHYALVGPKAAELRAGDLFRAGIQITDSILGEKPFVLSGYVWRVVCANGMISAQETVKWSWHHDVDGILPWVRERGELLYASFEEESAQIRRLQDIPVEGHVSDTLRAVFAEYGIGRKVQDLIIDRAVDEGVETLYDVFNVVTEVANGEEIVAVPSLVLRLQKAAGDLARNKGLCPTCHSLVEGEAAVPHAH